MDIIQVINDNWIDAIKLNNIKNIAYRSYNNDKGQYFIENNKLRIIWEGWGKEEFIKINGYYYSNNSELFELALKNDEWEDVGIFNKFDNSITRKFYTSEAGTFSFNNKKLIINWKNWGNEVFTQINDSKVYKNNFKDSLENNLIKIIAIVFPQFHEIPENNKFWGHGFTEWTLLKDIPRIVNGEIIKQPHSDIGYFNLNNYEHRKYMRVLANRYNIYGFCFYHYWFKNKKVMYEPTELMLLDNEPNKPFLFCWANEQWTKRWDGGNNEILIDQEYGNCDDNISHFKYLTQFFKNENYIKKNNKPIFILYRIEEKDIENIKNIINLWNGLAVKEGFDGIHFMKFLGPFNNTILLDEISGYVEFEPGYCTQKFYSDISTKDNSTIFDDCNNEYNEEKYLKKNSDVRELILNNKIKSGYEHYNSIDEKEKNIRISKFFAYDGLQLYKNIINLERVHKEQHRSLCTSWNNTPRRNYTSTEYDKYPHYYKNMTSKNFGIYFKQLLEKVKKDPNSDGDFLFISAWNEWNEQAILEPNNEDGYDFLFNLGKEYSEFYNLEKNKKILNICHKGGGTEKYMNDLKKIFYNYDFIDFQEYKENIDYNKLYKDIDIVHINSILFNNLKDNYMNFFNTFLKNKLKYLTIHDYQWFYPDNPNIIKDIFFSKHPENLESFNLLLSICDKIIFPSNNIYNNYNIYVDLCKYSNKIYITNHSDKIINDSFLYIPNIVDEINIAYIGEFIDFKGSNIFKVLSKNIKFEEYNLKYHVFGQCSMDNYLLNEYNDIIFHNSYKDDNIIVDLHENNIHGIVHMSLFEESYCYALTNSINSGIPIFYINRGSFKDRLDVKEKYFPTNIDDIDITFNKFLNYIKNNRDTKLWHPLNNNIQPNRWYLTNY
jgi:hypothetical protein